MINKDMVQTYKTIEATSPDYLTKKVFKFGHTVAWITTLERDDYHKEEWGKLAESKVAIYQATLILNNLKKEGWTVI